MASVSRVVLLESALTASSTGSGKSLEPYSNHFVGWLDVSAINGGTTVNAKIQHSADGTHWVDLVSFTAVVGAASSEAKDISVGVLPYVRGVATLSGGVQSATVLIALYHDKAK